MKRRAIAKPTPTFPPLMMAILAASADVRAFCPLLYERSMMETSVKGPA
jgi:hypothetical protein